MRLHTIRIAAVVVLLALLAGCAGANAPAPDGAGAGKAAPAIVPTEEGAEAVPAIAPTEEGAGAGADIVPTEEGAGAVPAIAPTVEGAGAGADIVSIEEAEVPLTAAPAAPIEMLNTAASGDKVQKNDYAVIDYSNTGDGYIMVKYTASTSQRLKVQVKGPSTTYTYNLPRGQWTVFPLSDGNGSYQIAVYQNVTADKYATVMSFSASVKLNNEFEPFLRPNQYVNYTADSKAVAKAAELTFGISEPLKKVEAVYDYVVDSLSYDERKAATVQTGYLPVLDNVMAEKKGICFDYAALMTGMLRSQGVPCKLVVGYAGQVYHAWISVWTQESGWVDGVIFFDGVAWHRMDPTFASSAGKSDAIMSYIGDGKNYTVKYLY